MIKQDIWLRSKNRTGKRAREEQQVTYIYLNITERRSDKKGTDVETQVIHMERIEGIR
jgi:hypothetical protein